MNKIGAKIPLSELFQKEGFKMTGGIYCNHCSKAMTKPVCKCGRVYCHIRYYADGKYRFRRKLANGKSLTYDAAVDILAEISIDRRKSYKQFRPEQHSDKRANKLLFGTQIKLWLTDQKKRKEAGEMKPSYYNRLCSYDRVHFMRLYNKPISEINGKEIKEFKHSMDHLEIKTRKNVMSALHQFFLWFDEQNEDTELIENYTVPPFPVFKRDRKRVRSAITYQTQMHHLSEIPEQHRDIFEFAMLTGCRRGELCAYKVRDVILEDELIATRRAWSDHELAEPKNGDESWKILFGNAYDIAQKHIQGKHKDDWLFINPDTGRHYQLKRIDELWALTSSEVKFHEATRHSFITQMLEKGVPIKFVSLMASHKDLQSMKAYDHVQIKNIKAKVYELTGAKKRIRNEFVMSKNEDKY